MNVINTYTLFKKYANKGNTIGLKTFHKALLEFNGMIESDTQKQGQVKPEVILQKGGQLNIKIYRDDNIGAFAAYCAQDDSETKTILMNVYATFAASVENDINAKEFIIQNLMHEFGHALEDYYNKDFDENFVEKAVQTYFDKYKPDSPLSK